MTKKQTPIQTARAWAREHPDASGCIAVEYLVPKGKRGRRGMGLRRDHYLVDGGKAAKLTSRSIPKPDGSRLRSRNGYCYRCGAIYLQPVLRRCYVPNPEAGGPVEESVLPDLVYAPLGHCYLCPDCADDPDVTGLDGHILAEPRGQRIAWLGGGHTGCRRYPLVVLHLEMR